MSATILPIADILKASFDVNIPLYLDVTSFVQLGTWGGRDNNFADLVNRVKNDGLQIIVFDEQLKEAYPIKKYRDSAKAQLDTFEVDFDEQESDESTKVFAEEVEGIYFHDETINRRKLHAQFLTLARHATTNQHRLRIITAYPAFQRLINAEIYLFPDLADDVDLPANLDLFIDLGIHSQLRGVVANKLRNNDYIGLVQDGVQELFGYLQNVDPNFVGIDSWALVDRALGYNQVSVPPRNSLPRIPNVKLSNFGTLAEKDDHKGYYHFFGGAYSAFRNFSGHTAPSSQARHDRFGDKRTAIKILCFLSLLFEKIDQRVP